MLALTIIQLTITIALGIYLIYWKSYGTKTGEIHAMQDNLEKLVEQTQELTRTAETIKAELSHEQRHMEFRKEVMRELIESFANLDLYAANIVHLSQKLAAMDKKADQGPIAQERRETRRSFMNALNKFSSTRMLVVLAFSEKVSEAVNELAAQLYQQAELSKGLEETAVTEQKEGIYKQLNAVLDILRDEMKFSKAGI